MAGGSKSGASKSGASKSGGRKSGASKAGIRRAGKEQIAKALASINMSAESILAVESVVAADAGTEWPHRVNPGDWISRGVAQVAFSWCTANRGQGHFPSYMDSIDDTLAPFPDAIKRQRRMVLRGALEAIFGDEGHGCVRTSLGRHLIAPVTPGATWQDIVEELYAFCGTSDG